MRIVNKFSLSILCVALGLSLWLASLLLSQDQVLVESLATARVNEDTSSNLEQNSQRIAPAQSTRDIMDPVGDSRCEQGCLAQMEMLISAELIDDASYQSLLSNTDQLASYLKNNPKARLELLEIALQTSEGNKRDLIIAAFSQLSIQDRTEFGLALSQSPNREQRKEGVDFLAAAETMSLSVATEFSIMLRTETDQHIKTSLIRALNKPEKFRGDQAIIDDLSYMVQSEMNNKIRGEALLSKASLVSHSEQVVDDALSAVRSGEPDYQLYGLRALETALNRSSQEGTQMSWLYEEASRDIFYELTTPAYESISSDVRKEAAAIYKRHF